MTKFIQADGDHLIHYVNMNIIEDIYMMEEPIKYHEEYVGHRYKIVAKRTSGAEFLLRDFSIFKEEYEDEDLYLTALQRLDDECVAYLCDLIDQINTNEPLVQ
jgi:hypothetical protein